MQYYDFFLHLCILLKETAMKKLIYSCLALVIMTLMGCIQPEMAKQESLKGCDMAIFENGKVTFYNSVANAFVPFVAEKEFITNGAFFNDQAFYYTVAINDELFLKQVNLVEHPSEPVVLADWGLKKDDCYSPQSKTYSRMYCYGVSPVIMIDFDYVEDATDYDLYYASMYYNPQNQKMGDEDQVAGEDDFDMARRELYENEDHFDIVRVEVETDEDLGEYADNEKNYFYYIKDGDRICLSDKIDFSAYTEYYQPEFVLLGIGPSKDCVVYGAPTGWGFAGAPDGPLCFATLDGKVQLALPNTTIADVYYGWLSNGNLAYSDYKGIYTVSPDGTVTQISPALVFTTIKHY